MSHSSYKSKNFMRGEPNPINLVLNRALLSSQAVQVTCKCTFVDTDGAVVAGVFHGGTVAVGATFLQWAGGRNGGSRGRAGG